LDIGLITAEKGHAEFLEIALWKRVTKGGLDGIHLFGTIYYHSIVPLAVRMTKMWEYIGITDLDRVSTAAVTNDEVWSWLGA
jgi:hypothetical protein